MKNSKVSPVQTTGQYLERKPTFTFAIIFIKRVMYHKCYFEFETVSRLNISLVGRCSALIDQVPKRDFKMLTEMRRML